MLLHEKNKDVDHDLDFVLVCSHDMANMDAKEQADRMAAAEALYMISTRGNKGKGDATVPRKSKRGRKAKKPRSDFEEGNVKSNEILGLNESGDDSSRSSSFINKKKQRGHEGEPETTATSLSTKHAVSKGKGRGKGGGRTYLTKSDKTLLADNRADDDNVNKTDSSDRSRSRSSSRSRLREKSRFKTTLPEPQFVGSESQSTSDGAKRGRGSGKRGRGRGVNNGRDKKSDRFRSLSNHNDSSIGAQQKPRSPRAVRRKSPGISDGNDSSRSILSVDAADNLKSKPPPKKLNRFREKAARNQSNSSGQNSEDDTRTEIQAVGFTGAAVTLVKALPKGNKAITSQRKPSISTDNDGKNIQINSLDSIISMGSGASSSLANPQGLSSLSVVSEVTTNLPSLPIGIESLQLSSTPLPNLSSLSGLKDIKIPDIKNAQEQSKAERSSDKAQKVLPLKKRKLHNQDQEEEKTVEDGSDNESEEAYAEQSNSPSVSSQPQVQTKFTVQAHPIITMQTLMEINTALSPDEDGDLPLHIAVVHENMRMVTKLINLMKIAVKGVDKFNKQQQTPLHLAVKLNFLPAVALLISSGASVNTVDGTGSSAIHMAVQGRFYKCLEHMLRSCPDAEVNGRNFEGLSPLHLAVDNKDLEQVQLLLKYGAEIDSADGKSGRTALFHAAESNQKAMVELLLKQGANPDLPNYAGVTTTMAAQGRSLHSILKLIGSVTQEIKWSFVAVKTNAETQSNSEESTEKSTYPSVEVYAGKSLIHSELLKSNTSPHHQAPGEKSKIYHSMLVVKNADEEKIRRNSTTKPPHKSPSPSSTEVKKELDGHKGDEMKVSDSKGGSSSSVPALHRVKQEVIDSPDMTPSSNASSPSSSNVLMHKTADGRYTPVSQDGSMLQVKEGEAKKTLTPRDRRSPLGNATTNLTMPQHLTLLQPPQSGNEKLLVSPSVSPLSPRTPPSSTPDSVTFTSMQARLYKKLLEMYSMEAASSQGTSTLKSLPAFPTQPSLMSLAASPAGGRRSLSPHRNTSISKVLLERLSSQSESEQQTYVVRRNPVQRISVLPTPRDTLSRSDSPAFHGQSFVGKSLSPASCNDAQHEADPNVPLNLSSKTSGKAVIASTGMRSTGGSHTPPRSYHLQAVSIPSQAVSASNVPLDFKKSSGVSVEGSMSASSLKMPPLIHHSQLTTNSHAGNISPKNGERRENSPSSAHSNQNKEGPKKVRDTSVRGPGLFITDLPHITKSVSPKAASLVRTFLAQQPGQSMERLASKSPSSSSFSVLSSPISSPQSPHLFSSEPLALNKSPTPTTPMHLTQLSTSLGLQGEQSYVTITANTLGARTMEMARGAAVSDPKFLHQGRVIDLSQTEDSSETLKSSQDIPPPVGKIVGFSGAILSLSPPNTSDTQEERKFEKYPTRDTPLKSGKKRGRKSTKITQGSSDPMDSTSNKINHETGRKLKKYLGLKQAEPTASNTQASEDWSTSTDLKRSENIETDPNSSPVIETVGIFSGNIQHVTVGKSHATSPSSSAKTLHSKQFSSVASTKQVLHPTSASGSISSAPRIVLSSAVSQPGEGASLSHVTQRLTSPTGQNLDNPDFSSGRLPNVEGEGRFSHSDNNKKTWRSAPSLPADNVKVESAINPSGPAPTPMKASPPMQCLSPSSSSSSSITQMHDPSYSPSQTVRGTVKNVNVDIMTAFPNASDTHSENNAEASRSDCRSSPPEVSIERDPTQTYSEALQRPPKPDRATSQEDLPVDVSLKQELSPCDSSHIMGQVSSPSPRDSKPAAKVAKVVNPQEGKSARKDSQTDDENSDLVIDLGS